MIQRKKKVCKECKDLTYLYARGLCLSCDQKLNPSKHSANLKRSKPLKPQSGSVTPIKRKSFNTKPKKATGELELFRKLWQERGNRCQITGKVLEFSVWNFMHILSKGAYKGYRLNPDNILIVHPKVHDLYDNSSKEKLLREYPQAAMIYELKDKLRYRYYNN